MKRPWNIINSPVYSLATYQQDKVNMNICTYVMAVSMKPKMYAIAIDYDTATYQNLKDTKTCILQILSEQQIDLVKPLGKKSGLKTDKSAYLKKKELLTSWNDHQVLSNTSALVKLKKDSSQNVGGDHEIFFFSVEKFKTISDDNLLMFQDLIDANIIL